MKLTPAVLSLMAVALVVSLVLPIDRGQSDAPPALRTTGVDDGAGDKQLVIITDPEEKQLQLRGLAVEKQQELLRRLQGSGTWSVLGQPVYGDADSDYFGGSLAMSGDGSTIVGCARQPKCYCKVFTHNGSDYVQKGATLSHAGDNYGASVAISYNGDRVAVGATHSSSGGYGEAGCVYVYDFVGTDWQPPAEACGALNHYNIGAATSMSSDGTVIASSSDFRNTAEVHKEVGGVWIRYGYFSGPQSFGRKIAVSADGSTLAIGCEEWGDGGVYLQGKVYTYKDDGSSFVSIEEIEGPHGTGVAEFGKSLALSANGLKLIVGAPFADGQTGSVTVHELSGGTWSQTAEIQGTTGGGYFGWGIDASDDGETFVAATYTTNPKIARVYHKEAGSWTQVGDDTDLHLANGWDVESVTITADGHAVLLGDYANDDSGTDKGQMQVWVTGDHSISAGGDPHFYTFRNQHYDFHGHCDLVLLEASHFAQGKGLSVHIRSSAYKKIFSYISDAAIRIGDDILEVGGGGKYFFNGKPVSSLASETIGGYKMEHTRTKKGRAVYKIFLDGKEEIDIREYKNWITVYVLHPSDQDFAGTVGLMGSYETGSWMSRDGSHSHQDVNEFGLDWQVRESDGLLFQTPSPHPDKCDLPILTSPVRKRRLAESSISREAAADACADWSPKAMEDCIMDVLISEDLGMADGGPLTNI